MEIIKTERLYLRRMCVEDWEPLMRIWQALAVTEFARYDKPHPTDPASARARLEKWDGYQNSREHMFFSVRLDGSIIGYAAFNCCPEGYELGYGFHPDFHGKGYAAEALSALLEHLQLPCVRAGTAVNNLPSVRLLERLGFERKYTEPVSFYRDESGRDIIFTGGVYERKRKE